MRILQVTGLLMFLGGFFLFLGIFFTSNYQVTTDLVHEVMEQGEAELFLEHAGRNPESTYGSNFSLISDLNEVFSAANDQVKQDYGISQEEMDLLLEASQQDQTIRFSLEALENTLDPDSEVGSFKLKALQDYGGWLLQKEYSRLDELERDLRQVVSNIESYELINAKGFNKYRIKELKYQLTRAASQGPVVRQPLLFIWLTYGLCILGACLYILPKVKTEGPPGIKNNGIFFSAMKNRGWLGIMTGTFLIVFYIFLYFFPEYMTNWIIMVDPVSYLLKGSPAGRFFLYGFIYTLCILVMGVRMIIKYRHSPYQVVRTISVMFFQTAFAFLIPEILLRLNKPYFDFKNIWPLDYDFFFDNELNTLIDSGSLGIFMLGWGVALIVIAVPVLVYFFGKRWYCSWVCGCGGLAETLGDPYRHLSDKSLKAWRIERWMIHSVLLFAVVMTAGVLYTYWTGSSQLLGVNTYTLREVYGAWIGAGFAGVVGTGFYPFMGNRVWCRFGCPLAAYLGFVQRFKSRFRITTNGGQCISCGNCSTYCEMGIDVRWYAQRGQNIVRSSCVGCGICSAVCPRGVLNLENTSEKGRLAPPDLVGNQSFEQ